MFIDIPFAIKNACNMGVADRGYIKTKNSLMGTPASVLKDKTRNYYPTPSQKQKPIHGHCTKRKEQDEKFFEVFCLFFIRTFVVCFLCGILRYNEGTKQRWVHHYQI